MTFYASFWGAINSMAKKDQLPVFRAVVSYGLFGYHKESLSAGQNAFFELMKPVLDSSRKKAANGKQGGSKTKANGKQNATENEVENENEIENEVEKEKENESKRAEAFEQFWSAYPRKECKQKALEEFLKAEVDLDVLLLAIEQQKKSAQWQKDGGQFIPHAATWLSGKRWQDILLPPQNRVPMGCSELGESEKENIRRLLAERSLYEGAFESP